MKNLLFLLILIITCTSCTSGDIKTKVQCQSVDHLITISNDNKPFEYWLNKEYFNSSTPVSLVVPSNTQITIGAIVEVRNGVEMLPNIKVYQNNISVKIKQITKSFFSYKTN
jgi:hypothetical protein